MERYPTYLIHFGIKGQKWGDRRYQNEDGSLTPEGQLRYGNGSEGKRIRRVDNKINKILSKYQGEKGEENARKKGLYKVEKDMQKIEKYMTDKRNKGYFKNYDKYKKDLKSIEKKSDSYAEKYFKELKKKDKSLDSLDLEEMKMEAYENMSNPHKQKLNRYVALGFDKKTADIVLKASDKRYEAAANYAAKYRNKKLKALERLIDPNNYIVR